MLILLIGCIIFLYFLAQALRVLRYSKAAKKARAITRPFMKKPAGAMQHILVLGDSTMYGAGATTPKATTGGLLAAKYPRASVETLAVNGARVKDLPAQIGKADYQRYDWIIIGIGGNDIVRLTSFKQLQKDLNMALENLSKHADQIILSHPVNIGNIGFFLFPLNYFFSFRAQRLSHLYAQVAKNCKTVHYVNFYRPIGKDYYDKHTRHQFVAADGFHANDYANKYFFNILWQRMQTVTRTHK